MAARADALAQVYPMVQEGTVIVGVTALVSSLAMTHVRRGKYFL